MQTTLGRTAAAALLALAAFSAPARAEVEWFSGDGKSCDSVCKAHGRLPVTSGIHVPGGKETRDQFFVCAADRNGWRGGYNLKPSWSNVCMVGFGGKELRATPYICACE